MNYETLSQRHPAYDAGLLQELSDLYAGGYQILRHARRYLPQWVDESDVRYNARVARASYLPYFGQIVDQIVSWLFQEDVTVLPAPDAKDKDTPGEFPDPVYYAEFARDADQNGSSFGDILRKTVRTALTHRRAYLGVDLPAREPGVELANLAAEEEGGYLKAYLYEVPVEQVIDWKKNKSGGFDFIVLNRTENERGSIGARRGQVTEEFKTWEMVGGVAKWTRYEIKYAENHIPQKDTEVPKVAEGTTTFDRIPIHCFELPDGLWVGNKIGPSAKEHFQRRSELIAAEAKSLFAIPYACLGPEVGPMGGEIPSEISLNSARGNDPVKQFKDKGWVVGTKGDTFGFAEPSGSSYTIVDGQLRDLKDEIFRVVSLMAASVSNTPSSLGRSGLSKTKDQDDTVKVLWTLGVEVRRFAGKVQTTVSRSRSEDVIWQPKGVDTYDLEDRATLLQEGTQIDEIAIPSKTFRIAHKTQLASKLVRGLPDATQQQIRQEITEGVESEFEEKDLLRKQRVDALKNPPAPANTNGVAPPALPQGQGAPPAGPPSPPEGRSPKASEKGKPR